MAYVLKTFVTTYHWLQTDLAGGFFAFTALLCFLYSQFVDPRTNDWPLVQSPVPVVCICGVYMFAVLKWLPAWMATRKAFGLRHVLMAYNLAQVFLSAYILIRGTGSVLRMDARCALVNYSPDDGDAVLLAEMAWTYFIVKIVDMADTIFFLLRKKFNQVSFLHVYHHFGMVVLSWIGTKYVAGGESVYLGFVNCFVHVVMYFYYFYAIWRPKDRVLIMRIKKFVTQLQLMQFVVLECNYLFKFLSGCAFSKTILLFLIIQHFIMICMFSEFYYRTYIRPKRRANTD